MTSMVEVVGDHGDHGGSGDDGDNDKDDCEGLCKRGAVLMFGLIRTGMVRG